LAKHIQTFKVDTLVSWYHSVLWTSQYWAM